MTPERLRLSPAGIRGSLPPVAGIPIDRPPVSNPVAFGVIAVLIAPSI